MFTSKIAPAVAVAALLAAASPGTAHAAFFTVNSFTANSFTFTLSGPMPALLSTTGFENAYDTTGQIDIVYSGEISDGWSGYGQNTLVGQPFTVATPPDPSYTGNFGTALNYSWLASPTSLVGLTGSGNPVTFSWTGNSLDTSGTGDIGLYWGNVFDGIDPTNQENQWLGSTEIVDGTITDTISPVPLPGAVGMFGTALMGLAGLAGLRKRRKTLTA